MTGFEDCVVIKPWGYEFQVFDDGRVSIWFLHIAPGQGTSVHCHFGKRARFIPLAGTAVVRTMSGVHRLTYPQSLAVDRYEFHAVGNGGADDLSLIEIETPSDKADLFRLRDRYGRGQGYEGGDNLVREGLERYGHFTLMPFAPNIHNLSIGHSMLHIRRGDHISVHRLYESDDADVRVTFSTGSYPPLKREQWFTREDA